MPNFDQTGPSGQGKLTGRGLGKCAQNKKSFSSLKEEANFLRKRLEEIEKLEKTDA